MAGGVCVGGGGGGGGGGSVEERGGRGTVPNTTLSTPLRLMGSDDGVSLCEEQSHKPSFLF